MKVTYLDTADAEFQEAIDYFNEQRAGLGFEFSDEVKEAVTRIRNYPHAWTPLRSGQDAAKSIDFLTASSTNHEPKRSSSSRFNIPAANQTTGVTDSNDSQAFACHERQSERQ